MTGRSIFLAAQTVSEWRYGALVADRGDPQRLRLETALGATTVVPVTDTLITEVAELRYEYRRPGHPLAADSHAADPSNAASARHIGAPLLTADSIFNDAPGVVVVEPKSRATSSCRSVSPLTTLRAWSSCGRRTRRGGSTRRAVVAGGEIGPRLAEQHAVDDLLDIGRRPLTEDDLVDAKSVLTHREVEAATRDAPSPSVPTVRPGSHRWPSGPNVGWKRTRSRTYRSRYVQ